MNIVNILSFIINHPANRANKFKSVIKFFKWQIVSSFTNTKHILDWVDETKFILQKSEHAMTGNFYCGLMEFEEMCFVMHSIKATDKFYDIGANVGSYTLLASGVKGCNSVCFEPIPSTFDRLLDNINLNRINHKVEAFNKGVGSDVGFISFTNNLNAKNRVSLDPQNENTSDVEMITLDDTFQPSVSSLVKIDVEGYEAHILRGGENSFLTQIL